MRAPAVVPHAAVSGVAQAPSLPAVPSTEPGAAAPRVRLASLGDSFSCGEGVGLRVDLSLTWVGLLAAALGAEWLPLAVAGARVADVLASQVPAAADAQPDLATVLVGLNDVVRAGFDPAAVEDDVRAVVTGLRSVGCLVLLVRPHDPSVLRPVPGPLRRGLSSRVRALHAAVDALADDPGVLVLDLGAVPALRDRGCWAADRIHPAPAGHRAMAVAAAGALTAAGVPILVAPARRAAPAPSAVAQLRWLVAHGLPWTASHLRSVVLPMIAVAASRRGHGVPPAPVRGRPASGTT